MITYNATHTRVTQYTVAYSLQCNSIRFQHQFFANLYGSSSYIIFLQIIQLKLTHPIYTRNTYNVYANAPDTILSFEIYYINPRYLQHMCMLSILESTLVHLTVINTCTEEMHDPTASIQYIVFVPLFYQAIG